MKPGRELDALVAEKVMGWKWDVSPNTGRRVLEGPSSSGEKALLAIQNPNRHIGGLPKYSTDIAPAWEVVEKIKSLTFYNGEQWCTREPWLSFGRHLSDEEDGFAINLWFVNPRTICLAALKAIDYNFDTTEGGGNETKSK